MFIRRYNQITAFLMALKLITTIKFLPLKPLKTIGSLTLSFLRGCLIWVEKVGAVFVQFYSKEIASFLPG